MKVPLPQALLTATVLLVTVAAEGAELGGFASLGLGQSTYPADNALYSEREEQSWNGSLRLLAEAGDGALHFSANLLEAAASLPPLAPLALMEATREVGRSSLLTWEQHATPHSRATLAADVLQLQYRGSSADLILGRQPVSLATTFYFAPNDFFAPFAPQTFFRTYRPGVDGVRGDLRLAALSQLTVLAILAYAPEPDSPNGWRREPEWSRTSLVARYNREWRGFGWSLLAGTISDRSVCGGGMQGELFDWLGVRSEAHYAAAEREVDDEGVRLALGIEHRHANNFDWRLEYFYNGYREPGAIGFGDRHYAALGAGYEFTPLLNGSLVALADLGDGSQLFSANLLYSLTDEAELALTGSVPLGKRPEGLEPGSEFGRQPRQLLVEYRVFY